MNTTELLTIAEAIVPDRTAMIFDGREFTYAQISQRVNRLANAMAELGVTPGDRIATMQVNSHRSIELYFAAAQLDAVYVPINFRAKTDELHQMLRIAEPTCLFIGERYLELLGEEDLFGMPQDRVIILDAGTTTGLDSFEHLLRSASPEQLFFPEAEDNDTTVIIETTNRKEVNSVPCVTDA
ncbi:3-oxocholest-4-en-26-oate--CoA ligase [Geodia barretti]|uniref:3-oxocholest-4-en-26-oate--CoA ligase n=1 Tax=Geodia barretti TaxID=519541 RepID=A0AA35U083_GEOBA|nr:3-oxocholest-4-en-26-oate--CoA ligase [Geodia barretti]